MPGIDDALDATRSFFGAGFHRRIVSGGLLVLAFFGVQFARHPDYAQSRLLEANFLSSTVVLGAFLILIYVVGSVIEVLGDAFLIRHGGGLIAGVHVAFSRPIERFTQWSVPAKYTVCVLWWLFLTPILIWPSIFQSVIGKLRYQQDLDAVLSDESRRLLESFPNAVRDGLIDPTGLNLDTAWTFLTQQVTGDQKVILQQLSARNRDFASVVSALVCLTVLIWVAYASLDVEEVRYMRTELRYLERELKQSQYEYADRQKRMERLDAKIQLLKKGLAGHEEEMAERPNYLQEQQSFLEGEKQDFQDRERLLKDRIAEMQNDIVGLNQSIKERQGSEEGTRAIVVTAVALPIVLIVLFSAYFVVLRRSTVSAIELVTMTRSVDTRPEQSA